MFLNIRVLHAIRTLYVLSLPFMVLYFAFVWFILLPDNSGQPTTIVELSHYGLQTIAYFVFGLFLFPVMNRKFNKKMSFYVSQYKKKGFTASTFEVYSKFNDTYAGWDQVKNELLLIDVNKNVAMLVSYDKLINVQVLENSLLLLTSLEECPKFHVMLDKKNLDIISNKLLSVTLKEQNNQNLKLFHSF